jgi:hypothetical protein
MHFLEEFKFKNRKVEFSIISGVVISSDKRSETHLTSSGGGGHLTNGSGYIKAPTISSYSVTCHDFWLKTSDCQEVAIQLRGHDIPLRSGQNVTMLLANAPGYVKAYVALVNHSSGSYYFLKTIQNAASFLRVYKYSNHLLPLKCLAIGSVAAILLEIYSIYSLVGYKPFVFLSPILENTSFDFSSIEIERTDVRKYGKLIPFILPAIYASYRILKRTLYVLFNGNAPDLLHKHIDDICNKI